MKELAIVMPVYNEEEILENVINDWTNVFEGLDIDFEILAYNDGSKDKSLEILRKNAENNSRLIVRDKKNSGHGPTILQGYRDCAENYEWIFQTDSDNELGTEGFVELWKNRCDYDFLIGKRFYKNRDASRKIISNVAKIITRIHCGKGVSDVNCPYRLMKTSVFKDLFLKIESDTFSPNIIVSGFVNRNNIKFFEIPVEWKNRSTGTVSIQKMKLFKSAAKAFFQTINFFIKMK